MNEDTNIQQALYGSILYESFWIPRILTDAQMAQVVIKTQEELDGTVPPMQAADIAEILKDGAGYNAMVRGKDFVEISYDKLNPSKMRIGFAKRKHPTTDEKVDSDLYLNHADVFFRHLEGALDNPEPADIVT